MCPVTFELQGHHYEPIVPPDGQVIYLEGIDARDFAILDDVMTVTRDTFPAPYDTIKTEHPIAGQLRWRWRQVLLGGESPTAVAYFILTTVKEHYHGYQRAAKALNIARNIIETLSKISAKYDPVHGRKASSRRETITEVELHWIKWACPAIIRRVLEKEAGADIEPFITMEDLPPVST